jgi:hypothetical protein
MCVSAAEFIKVYSIFRYVRIVICSVKHFCSGLISIH